MEPIARIGIATCICRRRTAIATKVQTATAIAKGRPRNGEAIFREREVKVQDLFVGDFVASYQDMFLKEVAGWVASGEVRYREDIRHGFETIPVAFGEMMRGGNFGKMLVQVSDDPTL